MLHRPAIVEADLIGDGSLLQRVFVNNLGSRAAALTAQNVSQTSWLSLPPVYNYGRYWWCLKDHGFLGLQKCGVTWQSLYARAF